MIDIIDAKIEAVTLHLVGNKSRGEDAKYATCLFETTPEVSKALLKFFLAPFVSKNDYFNFSHHEDNKFNEVRNYVTEPFNDDSAFLEESIKIARHLYSVGNHPNIHSGELFVCKFSGIRTDGHFVSCIGIFKSETKNYFLTYSNNSDESITAKLQRGAQLNGLDKGALVIMESPLAEPKLLILDKKNSDAQYWINSFLNAQIGHDDAYRTEVVINTCANFSKSEAAQKLEKKDVISLNNYVVDYFRDSTDFNSKDFFEGIKQEAYRDDFKEYLTNKVEDQGVDISSHFRVAPDRVIKITKKIKNIIKLDTSIELKVGNDQVDNSKHLEKGYDEVKKMYFYKVYFNEEIF